MRKYSRKKVFLALLAALFLLGQFFFVPKIYVQSRIVTALQAPFVFLRSLKVRYNLLERINQLQLENLGLQTKLLESEARADKVSLRDARYVYAPVYSRYPLNNADRLMVAVSQEAGVREGAAVFVQPGLFLGEVTKVYMDSVEVRTVFDPGWELPVKIGDTRVDALFVGGPRPQLTLISRSRPIGAEDRIFLADARFAYGVVLGLVESVMENDQALSGAQVKMPYNQSEIERVYIEL